MSWFRRRPQTESRAQGHATIDRATRPVGDNGDGLPVHGRGGMTPDAPRGIDAEFCWGDERKR